MTSRFLTDGVRDGDEVPHSPGSCPNDADDGGAPANCVTLKLTVGDPSGSESERWNFEVFEEATGRTVVRHCDGGFGTQGSAEYALVKGKAYTFSLRWIGTNLGYGPDYDWQALINDSDATGAREGLYGTGAFIVEDSHGLLTEYTDGGPNNLTVGKEGKIIVPRIVTETVATSPPDRARKTIGVGEEVVLRVLPEGVDVFLWARTQGGGDLSYYSGSTTTYTAPSVEDDATITATVEGADCSVNFSVIEPTGILFENNLTYGIYGVNAPPAHSNIGGYYRASMYAQPDTVNFYKLSLHEGGSHLNYDGYFSDWSLHEMREHFPNGPHPLSSEVVNGKGTLCTETDGIGGGVRLDPGSYSDGIAYWELQWSYSVGDWATSQQKYPLEMVVQQNSIEFSSTNTPTWTTTKDKSGFRVSNSNDGAFFINP